MSESCDLRNIIVDQCLEILKRKNVKAEIKNIMKPMISILLQEIYPYIYLSLIFNSIALEKDYFNQGKKLFINNEIDKSKIFFEKDIVFNACRWICQFL